MTTLSNRLSARLPSRRDVQLVLQVCAFPGHMWMWVMFLYRLPVFLLNLQPGEIWVVFSYMQIVALLETLLLCGLLIVAAAVLPRALYRDQFAAQSALIVLLLSLWAIAIQVYFSGNVAVGKYTLLGITLLVGVGLLLLPVILRRWRRISALAVAFEDQLAVLAWVYLVTDLLGLLVIIVRKVFLILI